MKSLIDFAATIGGLASFILVMQCVRRLCLHHYYRIRGIMHDNSIKKPHPLRPQWGQKQLNYEQWWKFWRF